MRKLLAKEKKNCFRQGLSQGKYRVLLGGLPHLLWGMERVHMTDNLTGTDQKIPD